MHNGARTRQDFEVDPYFSSTNTDFGGDDPAKDSREPEATLDPTNVARYPR